MAQFYKPGLEQPRDQFDLPSEERAADNFMWTDLPNNEVGRAQCGWVEWTGTKPDPEPGKVVTWDTSTDSYVQQDAPAPPNPEPRRLPKVDFERLFTNDETKAWNKTKRRITALTEEDYDDPTKELLIQAEIANNRYNAILEFVEMDHPETVAFVSQIMVGLEIVTAERATEVLAGTFPA